MAPSLVKQRNQEKKKILTLREELEVIRKEQNDIENSLIVKLELKNNQDV